MLYNALAAAEYYHHIFAVFFALFGGRFFIAEQGVYRDTEIVGKFL
nr:MAG TPA: hypothetical protein [Caudoviricetes sp.]